MRDTSPEQAQAIAHGHRQGVPHRGLRARDARRAPRRARSRSPWCSRRRPRSPPVSPKPVRNIALGAVLGLLLGLGAALVRETLDKTVKTQDDVKADHRRADPRRDHARPGCREAPADRRGRPPLAAGRGLPVAAHQPAVRRRREPPAHPGHHVVPGRRGQVDDVGQPRAHHGAGRLQGLPRRGRPAPPQGARLPRPRGRGGPHRRADRPGRGLRRDPALRRHQPVGARRGPDPAEPLRAARLHGDAQPAHPPRVALRLRGHRLPAHAARSPMPWCSRAWSTA